MADIYTVHAESLATGEPVNVRVEFEQTAENLATALKESKGFNQVEVTQTY